MATIIQGKKYSREEMLQKAGEFISRFDKVLAAGDGSIWPDTNVNRDYAVNYCRQKGLDFFEFSKKSNEESGDKDLSKMKKAELVAYAEELGVDLSEASNNGERVAAIEKHLNDGGSE